MSKLQSTTNHGSHGMFRHFFAEPIPVKAEPAVEAPSGFFIQPKDYLPASGDTFTDRDGIWRIIIPKGSWVGVASATWLDEHFPKDAPHHVASPLPVVTPEKWEPTCEYKQERGPFTMFWKGVTPEPIQRKWTCGDREQWRAVQVTQ